MTINANTQVSLTDLEADVRTAGLAPTAVSTTPYTLVSTDGFLSVNASSISVNTLTVNLTTAVGVSGKVVKVKKVDAAPRTVTIDANSTETIDGQLTYILTDQYQSVTLTSDGANWIIS